MCATESSVNCRAKACIGQSAEQEKTVQMIGKTDIDARLAQHIAVIDRASLVFCP